MMEAGWLAKRVARQLGRSDCVVRRCWDQWIREMSFTHRPHSGRPRQTSCREDHHIRRESRFNLNTDDNRARVWNPRGERLNPEFALQQHTALTACVMVENLAAVVYQINLPYSYKVPICMEGLRCDSYNKSFTGIECFKQNEASEEPMMPNSIISMNNSMNVIVPHAECKYCKKQFLGPKPYQQHLTSAAHKKKVGMHSWLFRIQKDKHFIIKAKKKLSYRMLCDSEDVKSAEAPSLSSTQGICNTTESSETHLKYMCVFCNISVNGPVTYEQHLHGKYHKKKIKEIKSIGEIDSPLPNSTSQNSIECIPQTRYYCYACKKQCSGWMPFQEHIASKRHYKIAKALKWQQTRRN
ncbi:zinc finger protein [Trichonephila clavipes]|nr:zinc finger protein [Trichonephila clavipes]